jgi:gluconate kinase
MKPEMLTSQLAALEEPSESEALTIDIAAVPSQIIDRIRQAFSL